jgi:spore maturation protein SpmB
MLRKTATIAVVAALSGGAAIGVTACGEDREGDVQFEGETGTSTTGTTGTTGTTATEKTGTETTP